MTWGPLIAAWWVCCKNCPVVVIAPMVETLSHLTLALRMGVCPQVAQVRVTVGFRLKPTSSTNTSVSPSSTFFFQRWDGGLQPGEHRLLILLLGLFDWFLWREPPLVKHTTEVIDVVPHVIPQPDQFANPGARPPSIWVSRGVWPRAEQLHHLGDLSVRQSPGWPRGHGGVERTLSPSSLPPLAYRAAAHPAQFTDLCGTQIPRHEGGLGEESALFLLLAGQPFRMPDLRHTGSLPPSVLELRRSQ